MAVLSIQSHVSYGHVGNSAAIFALQRLGHEVWPIHTVNFATHTGHGPPTGTVTSPDTIRETVARLDALGILGRCAAVLTGYIGSEAIGAAILDTVGRVRDRNPDAIWCCDPVMGDRGRGLFVQEPVAAFFAEHAAGADILTPNLFELERLTGAAPADIEDAAAACAPLLEAGVREVVVTSLPGRRSGEIASISASGTGSWWVSVPEVSVAGRPDGAGDLFAALYLGRRLSAGGKPDAALAHAAAAVHGVLRATVDELDIVGAQEELVAPGLGVSAEKVG